MCIRDSNTPGANANAVKELVLCGMLLASRGIVGGIEWCKENAEDPVIGKTAEKAKKQFAGREIKGKTLGVIGLGAIGAEVANAALGLGMEAVSYTHLDVYKRQDRQDGGVGRRGEFAQCEMRDDE